MVEHAESTSSRQGAPQNGYPWMKDPRTIVLVGMMGAGKSAIGRLLADRLHLPFIDADTAIEEAAGMTIPEIFEKHGEESFRDGERRVIARLLEGPPCILATGGGAFMNEETRETISELAVSVWLKADFDVLWDRVSRKNTRPLLRTQDPQGTLRDLIEKRYPVYALADITVESGDATKDQMVDRVLSALEKYARDNDLSGQEKQKP